jgi:hypothetical protein
MGLLHPGLLLLGIGIAVPIILHLFQRHQGPRIVFPALRYLRRAEKESARKVRLRQLLLMLLRIVAVLLLAFAAARPFVRAAGVSHEPTAVVIILDNSASASAVTKDVRVLDVLKDRALQSLDDAEPEDEFWLIRAGSPDEPAYRGDAIETARRVRETEPTDAAADIGASINRARTILAAAAQKRAPEIQLLSDLQTTNFLNATSGARTDPPIVAYHYNGSAPPNRAITSVSAGGGMAPNANERSTLTAAITGSTDDSVNVRLVIDGRLAAASRAPAGGTAVLTMPARAAGVLTGWVEMDADAMRADNRRYFATVIASPPTVALSRAAPFFGEALAAMEAAGRVRVVTPAAASVVILPGGGDSPVLAGGHTMVIFPPESPLELQAVNRRLAASGIPWSYVLQAAPGEARFALRDSADALLRTLESARMRSVYTLQASNAAAGDTVLLRLRDNASWAVRGERAGGGRYILLASPLTESASSIPTSAAMLPLLDRIIRTWAATQGGTEEASAGNVVSLPPGADGIMRPDSVLEPVSNGQFRVPARAGIYQVMSGRTVVNAFAVNPPTVEADLARVPKEKLRSLLPSWPLTVADDENAWGAAIYRQRLGHELWRTLLIALLLVLLVEGAVAATGNLHRRTAVTETA